MTVSEKIEYLKGLADGLGLDDNDKHDRLFKAVIGVLEEISESIEDLNDVNDQLCEQLDAVDEDLAALEDDFYEDDECECDDDYYEVECPKCGDIICLDESQLEEGEIECPGCGEKLEFDFDECDDCDGCDCGCDEK